MPDDLERQLEAFGATLDAAVGEPIAKGSPRDPGAIGRPARRRWAIAGAAACLVAAVAGLALLTDRVADAPATEPLVPTSTSTPPPAVDPSLLLVAPIEDLATGCNPTDVIVSAEYVATGDSLEEAFAIAHAAIVEHTPPGAEVLPTDGWIEVEGEPTTVRYLDRGRGVEAVVRILHDDPVWRVSEVAQCVSRSSAEEDPATTTTVVVIDDVPSDPLGLERDGWTLVQRTTEPFSISADDVPCESATDVAAQINGVDEVHDILTPPEGGGLDLDVEIIDVGSLERGNVLADVIAQIGRCVNETEGIDVETTGLSSIRATWFRAGPDFALVTIVGEGARSIVLEIEGAEFTDDLIGDLAIRADQFLRGVPVTGSQNGLTVADGSGLGGPQVEPQPGQVKLWVSNQSFEDDPVGITVTVDGQTVVDAAFEVGGQHNWSSVVIDGLEPGEHSIAATSDTGVTFEGTFTLPPDEPRWMVVDYWYSLDDVEGRHFTFGESDEPIYFA